MNDPNYCHIGNAFGAALVAGVFGIILGVFGGCDMGRTAAEHGIARRLAIMRTAGVRENPQDVYTIEVNGVTVPWASFLRAPDEFLAPKKEEAKP